jgi:hypothetical protein
MSYITEARTLAPSVRGGRSASAFAASATNRAHIVAFNTVKSSQRFEDQGRVRLFRLLFPAITSQSTPGLSQGSHVVISELQSHTLRYLISHAIN